MAVKKWTPKEMERWFEDLFEPFPRMFGEFFEPFPRMRRRLPIMKRLRELEVISPAVDMYDKKDEIVVKAEIPGVDKENINISISDSTLTIKGEMKREEEVKEEGYYYSEREYGSFARALDLPAKVQSDKIKASFKNGILEIRLPKAEEAKPKEVRVEVK